MGRKTAPLMLDDEDEDVAAERSRVSSGAAGADILQVNQLTKIYQHLNRKIYAVKRLSVGIPAGEVSLPARRPTFGRGDCWNYYLPSPSVEKHLEVNSKVIMIKSGCIQEVSILEDDHPNLEGGLRFTGITNSQLIDFTIII